MTVLFLAKTAYRKNNGTRRRIPFVSPIVIPVMNNNRIRFSRLFLNFFATRNHNVINVSVSEKFVAFMLRSENAKDIIRNAIKEKNKLIDFSLLLVRKYCDNVLYTSIPINPDKVPHIKREV